jgi:methylenetetrahydrofolate/methylenetetrahydromethanopterin dehydrogenase (NADP+)
MRRTVARKSEHAKDNSMKKILIQLDSDKFASTFDAIVAHDAGADIVQSYGGITPPDVRSLILSAFFTRGIPDLKNLAAWIGGSDVDAGEEMLKEARSTFFGPFKISLMLDSNGCNTTASTAIAKLARQTELRGRTALVVGPGPVGLRAAVLLAGEGCCVHLTSIPSQWLGDRFNGELSRRTLASGRKAAEAFRGSPSAAAGGSVRVDDVAGPAEIEGFLNQAEILVAAGPAGLRMFPKTSWAMKSNLKWLLDFNLTEPLGIEGIKPGDDFADYDGKRALGALAIGNPKMKVHKACIDKLFERNDLVLDFEGVYNIAKQLI